ncbi:Serine/threonine-protein phosphatase (PP1) regulatory subunit [Komagataella phaffii CBS 7435]|uniref:CBM21 domain-containing protein n=2 Tax=Komagataella phaffii TaxID=460519 RepID=C4R440_KOMPG|nr:Hypothetical protein PAS_chr3_0286 [Komagataella phaffii GS115]AOA63509.1 GQ67_03342T0 [Komagataella phaffii]CAH2449930.1 Serine/threonine-protein phosphatase (PP1) regulatory subunit [Komagataella phaffii CBS 7435]AOA68221.1 GQ68_03311T0 [Komagataella phaffii GS115]CAY70326.1 Hypothetical protein PAS_chr3_0286 [Komagataella phaffii GS115]SCV12279.1 Serine/threonine-protein phosphatase (PP1) regulatory subunit [Komagataella phaffii CBS 7435]
MAYLGPKVYKTTPLTSNNLAFLNSSSSSNSSNSSNDDTLSSTPDSVLSLNSDSVSTYSSTSSEINQRSHYGWEQMDIKVSSTSTLSRNDSTSSLSTIVDAQNEITSNNNDLIVSPVASPRPKAGGLLKPSLKLPILKRCSSVPNYNEETTKVGAKSVRFSEDLERIKIFNKSSTPMALSTDNSPISSPLRREKMVWDEFSLEYDDDDDQSGVSDAESESDSVSSVYDYNIWRLISSALPLSGPSINFQRFVNLPPVVIESIKLSSNKTSIIGFIYVKNVSFEKRISIIATTDNWKNTFNFNSCCNYISSNHIFNYEKSHSPSDMYDKFSFIIKIDDLVPHESLGNNLTIQLCAKYETAGQVFWDSDFGRNYRISLTKITKHQVNSAPYDTSFLDVLDYKLGSNASNSQFKNRYQFSLDSNYSVDESYFSARPLFRPSSSSSSSSASSKKSIQRTPLGVPKRSFNTPQGSDPKFFDKSNDSKYNDLVRKYCFYQTASPSSPSTSEPLAG